jgi:hypothetical protein
MAKKTIALVVAFLLLVWSAKYYQDHYTIQPSPTNSTKKPMPSWGGPESPIIVPPSPNPELQLGIYVEDPSNVSSPEVLQAINWSASDPLYPGESRNSSIYVKNEGDVFAFKLNLSTSNWHFQDYNNTELSQDHQQYFNLTWNYDDTVIAVDEVKPLTLTLSISPLIENVTTFSFDIIITMMEWPP